MKQKDKILNELEKRKDKLREKGVKKIGLFGSYLKGKQKRGSDIDILVEFNKTDADNYFGLLDYLEKIFKGNKIDLVIESGLKPEVKYVSKETEYVKI